MGTRGPVPKHSTQRRRRNKESKPEQVKLGPGPAKAPRPPTSWHPIARRWYRSLAESGQAKFYEPSDWAMAYLVAESISRDLKPQFVAMSETSGEPVIMTVPMRGASLAAYLKAMAALLVSEGDRRRAGIELARGAPEPEPSDGVADLADYRKRLSSG